MRVDLYTMVHKAQRFHLFQLSDEIGKADFTDEAVVERVRVELLHMVDHLRDHARNEETYIHPLFRRLGDQAGHFETEHHGLDGDLDELERIVAEKRWGDLYSRYTQFLGRYLVHLHEEEKAQAEVLWTRYGDDELGAVFARFKAERAPQASRQDLVFMLPALSVSDLARMFQGMKASAPEPVFRGACDLAEQALGAAKWEQVQSRLRA